MRISLFHELPIILLSLKLKILRFVKNVEDFYFKKFILKYFSKDFHIFFKKC